MIQDSYSKSVRFIVNWYMCYGQNINKTYSIQILKK